MACSHCLFCNHDLSGHCENSNPDHYGPEGGLLTEKGGAMFGYTDLYGGINGGQAEFVRVPYADFGPRIIPDSLTDDQALFLTDIFPTGYSAIDWGEVNGGEIVAIFGAGPVGVMAAKSAKGSIAARLRPYGPEERARYLALGVDLDEIVGNVVREQDYLAYLGERAMVLTDDFAPVESLDREVVPDIQPRRP